MVPDISYHHRYDDGNVDEEGRRASHRNSVTKRKNGFASLLVLTQLPVVRAVPTSRKAGRRVPFQIL